MAVQPYFIYIFKGIKVGYTLKIAIQRHTFHSQVQIIMISYVFHRKILMQFIVDYLSIF